MLTKIDPPEVLKHHLQKSDSIGSLSDLARAQQNEKLFIIQGMEDDLVRHKKELCQVEAAKEGAVWF